MGAHHRQCSRELWDLLAVGLCHPRVLGRTRVPKAILSLCRVALGPKFASFGSREQPWLWQAGSRMVCACWQCWGWWDPNMNQQH